MDKVIFLDRDGTLNEEVNYLYKPEDLKLLTGVAQAIRMWREAGYKIVVVTNQAGVARGYYTCEDVEHLHEYMNQELKKRGAWVDYFFYCPHHPVYGIGEYKKECTCRKPGTGLFQKAEEYYRIDKKHSYMIGDKLLDIQAGHDYGVGTVLVGTGYGADIYRQQKADGEEPIYDFYAEDLMGAARYIMEEGKRDGSI